MYQRDRPVVPDFDDDEPLYFRYRLEHIADGRFQANAVRFPEQSVNRGMLSDPADVLFDEKGRYDGWGSIELRVSDIPPRIGSNNSPIYYFSVRHSPQPENYSHSDICSYNEGPPQALRAPSKTVKLEFRTRLTQAVGIERVRIPAVL